MKFLPVIVKSLFSVIIFVAISSAAENDFQKIIVASLGFIYIAIDFGFIGIRQTQNNHFLTNLRMHLRVIERNPTPDDKIDLEKDPYFDEEFELQQSRKQLDNFENEIKINEISIKILSVTYLIISINCLYLIFKAIV